MFEKRPKYLGNDVDLWEMAQLLKNLENDLEIWKMAKIFGKWLRCMGHGLSIWESLSGKWRIYLKIGLSVWETAKIVGKWRRSVGNGSNMWGNDLIICQTS